MIRMRFTCRCMDWHYHRRLDIGTAIKVQCSRQRWHRGKHYWCGDSW